MTLDRKTASLLLLLGAYAPSMGCTQPTHCEGTDCTSAAEPNSGKADDPTADAGATGDGGEEDSGETACDPGYALVAGACAPEVLQEAYFAARNTDADDAFGFAVAVAEDGSRLVVGAPNESSWGRGVNSTAATDNSAPSSGAAYVFVRDGSTWVQEAYLKALDANRGDLFGSAVTMSQDGSRIAIGAYRRNRVALRDGGEGNGAGGVYVYVRSESGWSLEATLASSSIRGSFGVALRLSANGETLVATGTRGTGPYDQYQKASVFERSGTRWTEVEDFPFLNMNSRFALSGDGRTLAVYREDDSATRTCNERFGAVSGADGSYGAVFILQRLARDNASTYWAHWHHQCLKAPNPDRNDDFGSSIALSHDGNVLAVSAPGESSNATGTGGNGANNDAPNAGAVYVFVRAEEASGTDYAPYEFRTYIKASNGESNDRFGERVTLSGDGHTLAVHASGEASSARGVGGDAWNNDAAHSGAVYVFRSLGSEWAEVGYVKAPDNGYEHASLGDAVLSLSFEGTQLFLGAPYGGHGGTVVEYRLPE